MAQEAQSTPPLPCEFHVWPSTGLAVMRAHAHDNFVWSADDGQRGIVGLVSHSAAASSPNVNDAFFANLERAFTSTLQHFGRDVQQKAKP